MPGGVNLHIRTRSSRSTRVLPLSGVAFRVGPGRQCEVRLEEGGPADVQCLLRRRGETWHVQPVARDGALSLGGKVLETPRPFPLGVPLRVGEHYLTLLPPDPASYADEPILVDDSMDEADVYVVEAEGEPAEAPTMAPPAQEPPDMGPGFQKTSPSPRENGPTVNRVDSAAWEARLRQRERWLSDRKREGEWEARWKALGENLRASAEARAAEVPAPTPRSPQRPRPRPAASPPPDRVLRIAPEPAPAAPRRERVVSPPRIYQEAAEAPRPAVVRALELPPILLCLPAPAPPPPAEALTEPRPLPASEPLADALLEVAADLADEVEAADATLAWPTLVALPMLEHHALASRPEAAAAPEPVAGVEAELVGAAVDGPEAPEAESDDHPDAESDDHPDAVAEDPDLAEDLAERLGLPVFRMGELSMLLGRSEPDPGEPAVVAVDWGAVEVPEESPEPPTPLVVAVELDSHQVVAPVVDDQAAGRVEATPDDSTAQVDEPSVSADRPVAEVAVEAVEVVAPVEPVAVEAVREPDREERRAAKARVAVAESETPPEEQERVRRPKGPWIAPGPRRVEGMPSASSILAAGAARPADPSGPKTRRPRADSRWPRPSEARRPSQWRVPGATWYGVPAALAAALIGGLMVHQAFQWALADREAGALADRLARLQGVTSPDPRALEALANSEAALPDPSWTRSTSAEIAVRVAALARAGLDPVREERVVSLLDAGRHVAPAQPAIRYALAWRSSQMGEGEALGSRLGLSRDVATLAWSARQLLDAGETGPALALYKEALGLAGVADLDHLDRPSESDQPQVRRFLMPYEALASLVLRDLIDARPWGLADWETALTNFAPIPLAAARLLRERGSPDADRAMELAIKAASAPAPEASDPAVHLAAGAEAMALAGRWAEAEVLYRKALDALGSSDGSTEIWLARSWYYNLADLYTRLGEPERAKEARRLALGNAPNDEITRLIMRAQHQDGISLFDGAASRASFSPGQAGSPLR